MVAEKQHTNVAGFSLIELMIAMTISLVVMGLASTLLAESFRVRARENQRSDALADAQRALNIMSSEIANSGFGLTSNGIYASDSGINSIRVRANLNAYANAYGGAGSTTATTDPDEDVKYYMYASGTATSVLVRYDVNTLVATQLANRLDSLKIHYYASKISYQTSATATADDITTAAGVTEVTPSAARYIVLVVTVNLPAVGTPNSPGYQPASKAQLVSDVTLRNINLINY